MAKKSKFLKWVRGVSWAGVLLVLLVLAMVVGTPLVILGLASGGVTGKGPGSMVKPKNPAPDKAGAVWPTWDVPTPDEVKSAWASFTDWLVAGPV